MYFCIETENIGRLYIFRYTTVDDALSLNLLQGSLFLSKKIIIPILLCGICFVWFTGTCGQDPIVHNYILILDNALNIDFCLFNFAHQRQLP